MFWSELIPCIGFLLLLMLVPESPRWLALKGRNDKAMEVLNKLHNEDYAKEEMAEIAESIKLET